MFFIRLIPWVVRSWRRSADNRRRQFHFYPTILTDQHARDHMTGRFDRLDCCGHVALTESKANAGHYTRNSNIVK
jgi:hypothetical protein